MTWVNILPFRHLMCIVIWCVVMLTDGKSSVGRKFYFAFIENRVLVEYPRMRIYMTSWSSTAVQITIQTPGMFDLDDVRLVLPPRGVVEHYYKSELQMRGNGESFEGRGIYIDASDDISVQAANVNELSSDAFLVYPLESLGTEYFVLTYIFTGQGKLGYTQGPAEFGIVATEDMTDVEIRFRVDVNMDLTNIMGASYDEQEGALRVQIKYLCDTFQLQSYQDLTGTYIKSNKPIAVMVGTMWTSVGAEMMGDHLVEMLPPARTWGGQFVTVPVANRTSGDIFRILARRPNTRVRIYHQDENVEKDVAELSIGTFYDYEASSSDVTHVISNQPILLAQLCKSYSADGNRESDPFFTFVPPVEQYATEYTFATLSSLHTEYIRHYVNLVMPVYATDSLLLNGARLTDDILVNDWQLVRNTDFAVATMMLNNGTYTLSCGKEAIPIGAVLYGYKLQESYGLPLGQKMEVILHVCTSTEMLYADYFDNDCDGYIDEEIANKIDDDGDGFIDEDVYSNDARRWEGIDMGRLYTTPTPLPETTDENVDTTSLKLTTSVDTMIGLSTSPPADTTLAQTTYMSTQQQLTTLSTVGVISTVPTTPFQESTVQSTALPLTTSTVTTVVTSEQSTREEGDQSTIGLSTTGTYTTVATTQEQSTDHHTTLLTIQEQMSSTTEGLSTSVAESTTTSETTAPTTLPLTPTHAMTTFNPTTLPTTFSPTTGGPTTAITTTETTPTITTSSPTITSAPPTTLHPVASTDRETTYQSIIESTANHIITTLRTTTKQEEGTTVTTSRTEPSTTLMFTTHPTTKLKLATTYAASTLVTTNQPSTYPPTTTASTETSTSPTSSQHSTTNYIPPSTQPPTTVLVKQSTQGLPTRVSTEFLLSDKITNDNDNAVVKTTSASTVNPESTTSTTLTMTVMESSTLSDDSLNSTNITDNLNVTGPTYMADKDCTTEATDTRSFWEKFQTFIVVAIIIFFVLPGLCCVLVCFKACCTATRRVRPQSSKVAPSLPPKITTDKFIPLFDARDVNCNVDSKFVLPSKKNKKLDVREMNSMPLSDIRRQPRAKQHVVSMKNR